MTESYKLHIYGDKDGGSNKRFHFESLADAVETVEDIVTDDAGNWELKQDTLVLIDNNWDHTNVVHRISKSVVDPEHVKIHEEPLSNPR